MDGCGCFAKDLENRPSNMSHKSAAPTIGNGVIGTILPQEENRVGPRDLLTDHERTLLFEIPADDHELIRHYTLSRADQEFVLAKRGDRNKLGVALQLGLLRHPGFGWRPGAPIPETLIRFIALQLGIPTSVFKDYGHRSQTQTDHARELATWLGLRHSTHGDIPLMREAAADAVWSTDQGCVIARAIIDRLRDSGIILPDPSVIERAGISGRAKARRLAAETLTATLTADQIKMIDALLVVDPATKRTSLAWLRDVRTSPTANNMLGVIERLRHVRSIGIDPAIAAKIHEWRFQQLVREGSLTPAFLLEWTCPRLVESHCLLLCFMLELYGAFVAKGRMPADGIIKAVDISGDRMFSLAA